MSRRIERLLVDTHLWVAAAAAGLVLFCFWALGLPPMGAPVVLVGASTLLIYRFDGWVDADRPSHGWLPAAAAAGLLVWSGWQAPVAVRWFVGLGAIPCLLYGWRLPGGLAGYRCLREVPGVKPLFVTTALTIAIVGLPLFWSTTLRAAVSPRRVLMVTGSLWVLLLCNVTLFDLRDWAPDTTRGLRTLPVLMGPRRARVGVAMTATILAVLLAGGLLFTATPPVMNPAAMAALLGASVATLLCAVTLAPFSSRLQYSLWVDGIPLALGGIAWIAG